jgi:hypothetical protein
MDRVDRVKKTYIIDYWSSKQGGGRQC